MPKSKTRLSRSLLSILFLFVVSVISSCGSQYQEVDYRSFQESSDPTVITNVNLLSEDGETMLTNRNVFISNRKITKITAGKLNLEGVRVIDASGKYLIPGLIESHAHLQNSPNDLLIYPAHGVTYLREMGGKSHHLEWREQIKNGRLGPKLYITRSINSHSGFERLYRELFLEQYNVTNQQEAYEMIDRLIEEGYDAVKVWSFVSRPVYQALTEAAKAKSFNIVGHIPNTISLDDLWSSGQSEVVHIEEFTKALDGQFGGYGSTNYKEYLQYVKDHSDEVAAKVKKLGMSVGTTLWFMESLPTQALELETLIESLDLTYINPERLADWMPDKNKFAVGEEGKKDPERVKRVKIFWDTYVEAIHIMLDALIKHDVVILAGADSMTNMVVPGLSMHQELESLVNAGMSPAQAIRSATSVPAQWMNIKTGKIAVGYAADLIILNENPLSDIRNTRAIDTVVLDGKVLNKSKREQLLQTIRDAYLQD
jgi:hypothetical protein